MLTVVVKNDTIQFPNSYLNSLPKSTIQSDHRSSFTTVISESSLFKVMAISWVDRNRRFFVSTTEAIQAERNQDRVGSKL